MDPPIINESSFSAANASAYSLAGIWPFGNGEGGPGGNGLGLRMGFLEAAGDRDGGASGDVSSVTENSGRSGVKRRDNGGLGGCGGSGNGICEDECSKMVSTSGGIDLTMSNGNGKRMKLALSRDENGGARAEVETTSASGSKQGEPSKNPAEPPKLDYIHVRARRGQATDSHSLAERARREKISERMKILQDLVPGCNKVIGKAVVLDEIINYIQSLQRQVEFLSMKLEAVNSRMNMHPALDGFPAKDVSATFPSLQSWQRIFGNNVTMNRLMEPADDESQGTSSCTIQLCAQPFDGNGMMFNPQAAREFAHGTQQEWLHMQLGGGNFERLN